MNKVKDWKWLPFLLILLGLAYYLDSENEKRQHPDEFEIKNFPLYAQPDGVSCGPTSLRMVLKYYGQDLTLNEIRKQTKTDLYVRNGVEIGGTIPKHMEVALDRFGVSAYIETCDIEKLKWYVSQGRPPCAMVRSGTRYWHWVVVTGYTKDTIITSDPVGERVEMPIEQFKNAWNFTSDLYGRDMTIKCPICGGDGLMWDWAGPFNKCDVCGGSGCLPDLWWFLVEMGEAKGHIVIVPKEKPSS